jgi:glycosyltransferase involved in cell wall biosynthesis
MMDVNVNVDRDAVFFSVIVPVFNAERTIGAAIESVLSQHYSNFELILIDDGSTDGSRAICDQYAIKDQRVVTRSYDNQGVAAARNRGLTIAQGDYICFLDADDCVYPDWLAEYANNSGTDLAVQSCCLYDGLKRTYQKFPSRTVFRDNIEDGLLAVWRCGIFNSPWSKCFRRDILQRYEISFPAGMSLYEDLVFCIRYYQHVHSMCVLPYAGYEYRIVDSILTHRFNPPERYLAWSRAVVAEADSFKALGDGNYFRIIAESQYRFCVRYLAQFYDRMDCGERKSIYGWLKELGPYVQSRDIPFSWRVLKNLPLPIIEFGLYLRYRLRLASSREGNECSYSHFKS